MAVLRDRLMVSAKVRLGHMTESSRPTFHAQCVCSSAVVGIGDTEESIWMLTHRAPYYQRCGLS
jgi:hypothetical protein